MLRRSIALGLLFAGSSAVAACGDAGESKLYGPEYASGAPDADGGSSSSTGSSSEGKPPPPPGVFDWRDAVLYYAFVDRFANADPTNDCNVAGAEAPGQYKGGDWKGVQKKIEEGYFTDLGVNVLWITVPMLNTDMAGRGNGQGNPPDNHMYSAYHGYWPTELDKPEKCFGTKQDLVDLVNAAHAKGIKVLFDYAMVHVHDSSPVYAAHPDWFWPKTKDGGGLCVCSDTGPCTWANDGQRCWFADYLPHFDYRQQAARDWSVQNAVQWILDTGVDGYRLDAIKHVDGTWLTELRTRVDAEMAKKTPRQTFYMVGETFDFQNRAFLKSFVDPTTKLDGQFDFPLRIRLVETVLMRKADKNLTPDDANWSRNAPAGMAGLADFLDQNDGYYGPDAVMSTFVGNHDLPRSIHLAEDTPPFGSADDGKNGCSGPCAWSQPPAAQPAALAPYERLANAFAVLMTTKGAPLIYYGDEIGLAGAGDPDNRRMMDFAPTGEGPTFLKARIAKLTAARSAHAALRRGTRKTLFVDADLWVFQATITNSADPAAGDTVWVAINRSDAARTTDEIPPGSTELLVGGASAASLSIPARQARIFVAGAK